MSAAPWPKIAIIGAGPSGATLARILHLNDVPFTLFEGEASSTVRSQGGTLDLRTDSGLAAVKECKLWEEFHKHARYDGEAIVVTDRNYKIYLKLGQAPDEEQSHRRPEIDRTALRQMLIDSLPPGTVKWGHRVQSVDGDGKLHFDNGVQGPFDLVIGADGAWSKVRPLLTDDQPFFTGLGGVTLTIERPEAEHPDLYAQVNRGSVFAFDDGKALCPQQQGTGAIQFYVWSRRPENWVKEIGFDVTHDVPAMRAHLAELFADWHPQLRKFTQVAGPDMKSSNLYMLPVGNRWAHRARFTLLGDAAHLMTPFSGEGVNIAMTDAAQLATAIIRAGRDALKMDAEIRRYEEDMFVRVKPLQEKTKNNMDNCFSDQPDKLQKLVEAFLAEAPPGIREQVRSLWKQGVHGP